LNVVSRNPQHYPYHTQLAEVLGTRCLVPIPNRTEFEQLSVQLIGDSFELRDDEVSGIQRLNLKETCHESLNQALPERDFMRHIQMKTVPQGMQSQLGQQWQQQQQPQAGRFIQ
jgi:hypothetical protein